MYKVIVAVVPLYVALVLGYGSLKWWNIFTREQCDAINKLVCYFTFPLFTFEFTAHIDPFKMNFSFIAADTISKFIIMVVLALWAKCTSKGSFCWFITSFSLCTLTNALVVGVPMIKPMYGALGEDLVVQSSVVQAIIWLTFLLFVLEFRRTAIEGTTTTFKPRSKAMILDNNVAGEGGRVKDVEENTVVVDVKEELALEETVSSRIPFCKLMKLVWLKLVMNPNSYGCVLGISWAFISNRYAYSIAKIIVSLQFFHHMHNNPKIIVIFDSFIIVSRCLRVQVNVSLNIYFSFKSLKHFFERQNCNGSHNITCFIVHVLK